MMTKQTMFAQNNRSEYRANAEGRAPQISEIKWDKENNMAEDQKNN